MTPTLLDRLARRIVRNAPTCILWRLDPHRYVWTFAGSGHNGHLTEMFQREYPKGGWSWRRLLEIMGY